MSILVFLGSSVLELGPMYATDRRQTSDVRQTDVRQKHSLMSPPYGGEGIINRYNVTQYLLLPRSLPISPIRPASRVTRSCLHIKAGPTSSLERRVSQTQTRLINVNSVALTNLPHPCGLMHWTNLQASALTHERGHESPRIVNREREPWTHYRVQAEEWLVSVVACREQGSLVRVNYRLENTRSWELSMIAPLDFYG